MNDLSKELLQQILHFLPSTDLLKSVPLVSQQFHSITDNDQFWMMIDSSAATTNTSLTRHQLQRIHLYNYFRTTKEEIPDCLDEGNILVPHITATRLRRGGVRRACVASSTDHLQEQLENCLMDEGEESLVSLSHTRANRIPPPWLRWWSSSPAPSDQSSDILLFACRYPLTSLAALYIKPLQDPYYENGPVYTWRQTILRVYNLPLELLRPAGSIATTPCSFPVSGNATQVDPPHILNVLGQFILENSPIAPSDSPTIDALLQGRKPVLEQEHAVLKNCKEVLSYPLPPGVIGNVIAIELVGKRNEQRTGSGYFACIERVECVGIPLHPTATRATQEGGERMVIQ